jgi:cytidine deaminase
MSARKAGKARAALLIERAILASRLAYAPYSHYRVGAALLAADGTTYTGCNVENASYGLTNCAERTALFTAVAAGQRVFRALAVVADGEALPFPCGACRQVLAEFCSPSMPVHVASVSRPGAARTVPLGRLLPHSFRLTE